MTYLAHAVLVMNFAAQSTAKGQPIMEALRCSRISWDCREDTIFTRIECG